MPQITLEKIKKRIGKECGETMRPLAQEVAGRDRCLRGLSCKTGVPVELRDKKASGTQPIRGRGDEPILLLFP